MQHVIYAVAKEVLKMYAKFKLGDFLMTHLYRLSEYVFH